MLTYNDRKTSKYDYNFSNKHFSESQRLQNISTGWNFEFVLINKTRQTLTYDVTQRRILVTIVAVEKQ